MSARLVAAAEANRPNVEQGFTELPFPQTALVREAVATLGWGTMTYRCTDCGFEWAIWLTLGVEGPPVLSAVGLAVPSPFGLGSCPAWPLKPGATAQERAEFRHLAPCLGRMHHVRFADDETFETPRLIPDDAPRFALDPWHDCAQLVMPEGALIRARQFHHERASDG